ncbi:zinc finger, AN1-type domain, partial [Entomortierella lignicola]
QDHWRLENHTCPNKDAATQQDQRVPICPLCDKPVPIKKGENPNVRMEQHISAGCPEPATTTSKPIYTNSCNSKGCKNRSAIPIICQRCCLNYCLKHRLESDHSCTGTQPKAGGRGGSGSGIVGKKPNGGNNTLNGFNATRNARAAAAAESRATSTSRKDKDKCLLS